MLRVNWQLVALPLAEQVGFATVTSGGGMYDPMRPNTNVPRITEEMRTTTIRNIVAMMGDIPILFLLRSFIFRN